MEPTIYYLSEKEVHQFNFYVSVVWNTKKQALRQGAQTVVTQVRNGRPYIGFPWIRVGDDGEAWEDDDDAISGGLSAGQAEEVAAGLLAAVAYIRSMA